MVVAACGGGDDSGNLPVDASSTIDSPPGGQRFLAEDYPGDQGLGADPAVVWFEDFEAGSVAAVTARYDQAQGAARMQLVTPPPAGTSGTALALTAGNGVSTVDLFKRLPDHDEW